MNGNVNLGIARVHLLSRKKQTIIAILGVTFGISMFILMVSFMQGTNEFLQDAMLSSTPDIHIYSEVKKDYSSSIADDYFKSEVKCFNKDNNIEEDVYFYAQTNEALNYEDLIDTGVNDYKLYKLID